MKTLMIMLIASFGMLSSCCGVKSSECGNNSSCNANISSKCCEVKSDSKCSDAKKGKCCEAKSGKCTESKSKCCGVNSASDNATLDVIHSRKSVRNYTDEPVSKEQIATLIKAAMAAPTGMDRRPWEFIVVTDKDIMREWADTLPYGSMLKKAQVAIVVCGRTDSNKGGSPYWYIDCSAATQNLLLAAESIGLGAVWTAAYPFEDRMGVVINEYNLPDDVKPLCIIPIGHPTGKEQPKEKYNESKIHYDRFGK